jgi:hypothetical protein
MSTQPTPMEAQEALGTVDSNDLRQLVITTTAGEQLTFILTGQAALGAVRLKPGNKVSIRYVKAPEGLVPLAVGDGW